LIPLSSDSKPIAGEKKVLKNRFLKYTTIYKYIYITNDKLKSELSEVNI
jgi:hypothetical protein